MAEPARIWKELKFETETCVTCGVIFGVGGDFRRWRLKDHNSYYCPNGHSQCYTGETPEQKLQKQLDAANREVLTAKGDADWQRKLREKSDRKLKKLTKRIEAGVCPHCQRTFENVARHMQTKHPEEPHAD